MARSQTQVVTDPNCEDAWINEDVDRYLSKGGVVTAEFGQSARKWRDRPVRPDRVSRQSVAGVYREDTTKRWHARRA